MGLGAYSLAFKFLSAIAVRGVGGFKGLQFSIQVFYRPLAVRRVGGFTG